MNPQKDAIQLRLKELLSQGEIAARNGQRGESRRFFREALTLEPANEHAWLWLAYLAPSPRQSLAYLQEARAYHPRSERVQQAIAWAQSQLAEAEGKSGVPSSPAPRSAQPGRPRTGWAATQAKPVARLEPAGRPAPARAMAHPQPAQPPSGGRGRGLGGAQAAPEQPDGAGPQPPAPMPEARARSEAEGTRRGKRATARPQRHTGWLIAALVLLALGVVIAAVVYGLWATQPQPQPLVPPPTSWLVGTPSYDMGALRDEANAAIAREDWGRVIPILENMRLLAPDDDGARQQLAIAHLRFGLQLAEQDHLDEAIAHYDAAIRLYANDMDLQTARRLAIGYRDGRQAAVERRWDDAVTLLDPVYKAAPGFRDVGDLLFSACMERARAFEGAQQLEAARDAYARAAAIRPDSEEAKGRLAQIVAVLTPPTPTPTPRPKKRIEVDISEQRLRAYENDALVFDWLCSTGIPTMPTRYGDFQILDKIPEAWSSAWGLRMPYWMGIYWAGASENGIHALPILRNGTTLWSGYLGSRVSFGCIVLDTPNAAKLYDWAEIGTPIKITP